MMCVEWDWNTALDVRREEGIKETQTELLALINQGYTLEQLKERLTAGAGDARTPV